MCTNCTQCQGETISALCVQINAEQNLKEYLEELNVKLDKLAPTTTAGETIDLTSLYNKIIELEGKVANLETKFQAINQSCKIDWGNCSTNDFCTEFQNFVNKVNKLTDV